MPDMNKVLYNIDQRNDTTDAQKQTARDNIGAASQADLTAETNRAVLAEKAAKTEVVKGSGMSVSSSAGTDGQTIYTVAANIPDAKQSASGLMSASDKTKLDGIASGAEVNVQSNWNESDTSSDSYIQNKPANLVQDANYVHTDNNFTSTLKTKLEGIASGAEVNVQSNWAETNTSSDAYIQNKPSVPSIKTTSTTLPPVDTNVSNMTLFTDGRVTVNNSTDVGLLAPVGTQSDAGKVLKGNYTGSPGKFTAYWSDITSPLSAGYGITIANNIVSAKLKTSGGLGVDSSGLYLADGVVLVTKDNTFAEIKALYDAGRTPLLTYTVGSGNNVSYCYSTLESYFEVGGVKGFDFSRVAGNARTIVSHIQDNTGWLADTTKDLQYELTDGYGIAIDSDTNTISAQVDGDYGLSLAATGIRVKVNSSDALEVNSSGLAVKEGSITYQKMPKNIMLSLIGSDDNDQNTTVTAKRVTLADKTNRRLCFVNLLEAAQVLFMAKDASADHAHQIIHVDFEANVEPAPNYDNSSTQFSICAVATNMDNPNYVVDPTQEAKFVFGSDFKNNPRKNHITASFNIDPSQMTNTWITSDPELCIICDATTSSIDTRGLLFSNIRVSGFVFADR